MKNLKTKISAKNSAKSQKPEPTKQPRELGMEELEGVRGGGTPWVSIEE